MANEMTEQMSFIEVHPDVDECLENIPPKVGDKNGFSSTQPSGENEPLSDSCTFSTPAPSSGKNGGKTKSRLSGLQSALTPILKYLNIGNKNPTAEPKHGDSPNVKNPSIVFSSPNCPKLSMVSDKHDDTEVPFSHSGLKGDNDPAVFLLEDEYLLEITQDSTMQLTRNDSAFPDSMPLTPVTKPVNNTFAAHATLQPPQFKTSVNLTAPIPCPQDLGKSVCEAPDQAATFTQTSENFCSKTTSDDPIDPASCLKNNTFNTKLNCTLSGASSVESCQKSSGKAFPSTVCKPITGTISHANVCPPELLTPNEATSSPLPDAMTVDPQQSDFNYLRLLDNLPSVTLLDADSDLSSEGEVSAMEVTQDLSPEECLKASTPPSESCEKDPGTSDVNKSEELSRTFDCNVIQTINSSTEQSSQNLGVNVTKASLEATRDISIGSVVENSITPSEPSGQNVANIQTLAEKTINNHPINLTRDISSSQLSSSDLRCNTFSKDVTFELQAEPVVTSKAEEFLVRCATNKVSHPSPITTRSGNGTFNILQSSNLSSSTSSNTSTQISCPQNKMLDDPLSSASNLKVESEAANQASSVSNDTTKMSPERNQQGLVVEAGGSCDVQNTTLEKSSSRIISGDPGAGVQDATFETSPHEKSSSKSTSSDHCADVQNGTFNLDSLQKIGGNPVLGEAGALSQDTFETKSPSKQNETITLSETSSSSSQQGPMDMLSPTNACTATSSPNTEVNPSEMPKHNRSTSSKDPDTRTEDSPKSKFEAKPVVKETTGPGELETMDSLCSGPSVTQGLSDNLDDQSMVSENHKRKTFNLEASLDLSAAALITSTPMTNCKINFTYERADDRTTAAQKKLNMEGPSKPDGHEATDVPSNIICDRKTFLTQPTAKALLPASKTASQLLKYKPASTLPGKLEALTSGLPMTRQRTQAEAPRNAAVSDPPQATTGISSCYNLRPTAGSKLPSSGLRKPQMSSIPSGIQRAVLGLKLPTARSNAPASSNGDKLRGPPCTSSSVTNTVTKISVLKKHPLSSSDTLPLAAKRKKIEAPLPPSSSEASASTCDAANRARNLKQPKANHKAVPAKNQRDAAVPASTAATLTSCSAVGRARPLKQPATSHRPLLAKPQGHGCANCAVLEQQLKKLKEELLKYREKEGSCAD